MRIETPGAESHGSDEAAIATLVEATCRSAARVTLADKGRLFDQGAPARMVFLVLSGFVKTSHICADGTEITMDLLRAHGAIDYSAALFWASSG